MSKVTAAQVFEAPLMPVMVIDHLEDAVPLAQAMKEAGITHLEITLRTPIALEVIRLLSKEFPDLCVGAGSVTSVEQFDQVVEAGAKFAISPGASHKLLAHCAGADVPLIPGCVTPSEILTALEYGYDHLKFFPAEISGGAKYLAAISAPIKNAKFCPTGGVNISNAEEYYKLPCVKTIGGSWFLQKKAIRDKNWKGLKVAAQDAVEFAKELAEKYNK